MVKRVGKIVYKLVLFEGLRIYLVFYFFLLRKYMGENLVIYILFEVDELILLMVELVVILDRKLVKKNNEVVVYLMVYWFNSIVVDVIWEFYEEIVKRFFYFKLEV